MAKEIMDRIVDYVKKNLTISIAVLVVVIFVVGVSIYNFYPMGGGIFGLSANAAGNKAVNFINDNYLKTTGKATFESATSDSTLYVIKFKVTIQGKDQEDVAYVTKDGKYLFPQMQGIPIDLNQNLNNTTASSSASDANKTSTCDAVKKSDKPLVEAFIVSSCPYGLQMQRVLVNVVQNIPAAKNNIKVEYFGSIVNGKITSMHGDAEAQENLRQICIRQEQPALYWNYIACYIKNGDSKGCLGSTGVNQSSLTGCTTDPGRGLKYAQTDFDLANKDAVSGSPTLIIGGATVDEFGFGGRTADALKSVVCCAYNNKPAFCSQTLSKVSAATSFSQTYADANAGSSANSGATGANCAPATPKQ